MARDFDASNDKIEITLNSSQTSLDTVSYGWWCRPENWGGYKTVFSRSEGPFGMRLEADSGWGWVFAAQWSTTDGKWSCAAPTNNVWTHTVITYSYSSTSNDPIYYRDGSSVTVTDRQTPVGTKSNTGTGFAIGYMKPAGSYYWDGQIAEFAMWNRIITASEAAGMAKGLSPLFYPNGLVFYMPLIGNYSPEIEYRYGSNGTLTDTSKYAHPRIMYPAYGKGRRYTTAVGGASYTPTLTDVVTLVDTLPRSTARSLTDVTTLVDSLPRTTSRTLTDVTTLVDTIVKAPGKVLSDVFTLVDTLVKNPDKVLTDVISLVDTTIRSVGKVLTDVATLVDTQLKSIGRTLSDVATLVDTLTGKIDGKILTETVTLVDTAIKSISRTLTDVATLVDSVPKTVGRTLSDVVTLVDSIVAGFGKELLETITLVETHLRSVARTLSDTTTMVDTVIKAPSRILSEVVTLVDSIERAVDRVLSEALSLVESLPRTISRTLTDTATLVDTFTSNMTVMLAAVLTETLTLVDTTVRATNKLLAEVITLQDWVWQKVIKGSAGFIKQTISDAIWRREV